MQNLYAVFYVENVLVSVLSCAIKQIEELNILKPVSHDFIKNI